VGVRASCVALPPPKAPPWRRGALGRWPHALLGHQRRQHGRFLRRRSPLECARLKPIAPLRQVNDRQKAARAGNFLWRPISRFEAQNSVEFQSHNSSTGPRVRISPGPPYSPFADGWQVYAACRDPASASELHRLAERVSDAFVEQVARSDRKLIVTLTSGMRSIADNTSGGSILYRSSKAAVNMVMRSLAIDLASRGITCVVINPGWVRTDMGGPNATLEPSESISRIRRLIDAPDPSSQPNS